MSDLCQRWATRAPSISVLTAILVSLSLAGARPAFAEVDDWVNGGSAQDSSALGAAAPAPAPPQYAIPPAEFQTLPAFDLALPNTPEGGFKVGDRIPLKLLDSGGGSQVAFEPQEGANALNQAGFDLLNDSGQFLVFVKPGTLSVPPLLGKDPQGKAVARTTPLQITVTGDAEVKDQKPAPPEPLIQVSLPIWVIVLAVLLGLVLLGAVIYCARRWISKMAQKPAVKLPEVVRTEDAIALAGLEELEAKKLWREEKYKTHFFRTSEILKVFLGKRFGFDAVESTTSELLATLKSGHYVSDETWREIQGLFETLDLIKFTDHKTGEAQAIEVLRVAKALVIRHRRPAAAISPQLNQPGGNHALR